MYTTWQWYHVLLIYRSRSTTHICTKLNILYIHMFTNICMKQYVKIVNKHSLVDIYYWLNIFYRDKKIKINLYIVNSKNYCSASVLAYLTDSTVTLEKDTRTLAGKQSWWVSDSAEWKSNREKETKYAYIRDLSNVCVNFFFSHLFNVRAIVRMVV